MPATAGSDAEHYCFEIDKVRGNNHGVNATDDATMHFLISIGNAQDSFKSDRQHNYVGNNLECVESFSIDRKSCNRRCLKNVSCQACRHSFLNFFFSSIVNDYLLLNIQPGLPGMDD